jgi:hypothetical protein
MFHLRTKKDCAAIVESSHLVPKDTSIAVYGFAHSLLNVIVVHNEVAQIIILFVLIVTVPLLFSFSNLKEI